MAANPPYEGAVFVPGTMDEVGIPLLAKADDPQDIVAYAGYGFWAPQKTVNKVKGVSAVDIEVGPLAPVQGDQAVVIPELDGEVADPTPQGSPDAIGDSGDPAPAPEIPVTPTENDPTAQTTVPQPSSVTPDAPVENTAAADPDDATAPAPAAGTDAS